MTQMTVKKLAVLCQAELNKGNGDKLIVLSDDNEGNGYHGMFYGFTPISELKGLIEGFEDCIFENRIYDSETDLDKIIVLG